MPAVIGNITGTKPPLFLRGGDPQLCHSNVHSMRVAPRLHVHQVLGDEPAAVMFEAVDVPGSHRPLLKRINYPVKPAKIFAMILARLARKLAPGQLCPAKVANSLPIVLQLQKDALDSNESVGKLLRVAKAIAFKLELQEPLKWIDRELEGYGGLPWNDLPTYRVLHGVPEAFNPVMGWQAILFAKDDKSDLWARVPVVEPISSLEQTMFSSNAGGEWSYSPPPSIKAMYAEALNWRVDVRLTMSRGALASVIEAVRLLILNWTLALEKAGILGSEMTFSSDERNNAGTVTHQFFVQNLSYVSDVSGNAKVTTQQTAKLDLDIGQIDDLVDQTTKALPLMPVDTQKQLEPILRKLTDEIKKTNPDQSKLRGLLTGVKEIAQGAAGNLTAEGIIRLMTSILG